MTHPRTYTIEDWLTEYHPKLDDKYPLEPGMVFWKTTSVIGDGDGFYQLYLPTGTLASLTGSASTHTSKSSIRNQLHTGMLKIVPVEELSEENREKRIERLKEARDSKAEFADELRAEDEAKDWIELIESERSAISEVLEADE